MYFIIFLLLCISCLLFYLYCKEKNKTREIDKINENIKKENEKIKDENKYLNEKKDFIQKEIENKQNILDKVQQSIEESEQVSRNAFENYMDTLDKEYELKEKEYYAAIDLLNKSYGDIQNKVNAEIDQIRVDLDKISATRAAAIKAQLEEEKIQQQAEYYSLSIDDVDKRETKILQSIENELRDPRPIRMII